MQISLKYSESEPAPTASESSLVPASFPQKDSFKELEHLIGLQEVKRMLAEITAYVLVQNKRKQQQLRTDATALHMIFKGNPGTGKTTVARILGRILNDIGVLPKGHLIEAERADLVGEYIGHTAQKTREMIKKANGGILFIDEAYSLAHGGEKDFGLESLATLVKSMEDNRDSLIIILAGYSEEMDRFLRINPGLRSRFPIHINFSDYDAEELFHIALQMYQDRDYEMSNRCRWRLKQMLTEFVRTRHPHSGNARYVRNLAEKSIRLQALRIVDRENLNRKELITIEDIDLPDPTTIQA